MQDACSVLWYLSSECGAAELECYNDVMPLSLWCVGCKFWGQDASTVNMYTVDRLSLYLTSPLFDDNAHITVRREWIFPLLGPGVEAQRFEVLKGARASVAEGIERAMIEL